MDKGEIWSRTYAVLNLPLSRDWASEAAPDPSIGVMMPMTQPYEKVTYIWKKIWHSAGCPTIWGSHSLRL